MKLGRSFFSLYFLIISLFIIFSWILDEAWSSYIEQDIESYTGYKSMLSALSNFIEKQPEEEWKRMVEQAGDNWGLPLSLVTIDQINALEHENHDLLTEHNTHIFYRDDEVIIHHRIEGKGLVIMLGPAKMPTRPRVEALVRVLLLGSLAGMLFFWLRPLSRDLDQLRITAFELGQGRFDITAPKASSTMMTPLVATFNSMAQRIKSLIDAHKELSSAVAHELRTPLARSKFALQMLASTDDKTKQEKYRQLINQDIIELEELINEMLIYASFDSETPSLNFCAESLGDLVQAQVNGFEQYDKDIVIIDQLHCKVDIDRHFMTRAINNYISNAIKYGKDEIIITLSSTDDICQIRVQDNGNGVSDSFKETIFDAFSRGDVSRNKETGGFGLGLAIVRRIMVWHGGSASVEDAENGGACFILRWPMTHTSG